MSEHRFVQAVRASAADFLTGGGVMAALIQAHDWAATPLGPIEAWPRSLRSVLSICLDSAFPTAIYWGPELCVLYNDAWVAVAADRHPWALGRAAHEVWADIGAIVEPQMAQVLATGHGLQVHDQRLPMIRGGRVEETYWTYSFTPIRDENGSTVGLFNQGHDVTERVLLERRQAFRLAFEERLRDLSDPRAVMDAAIEMLGRHLGANRVGYSEVQADGETIVCHSCYANGVAPAIGAFALADFGQESIARQRSGRSEIYDDIAADPTQTCAIWEALDTRAFMSVPLVRDGKLRASLYVNFRDVHRWSPDEVELIEAVARRTWDAVERARAEAALRESYEHHQHLIEFNPQLPWIADHRDGLLEISPRWQEWTGLSCEEALGAGWMQALHPPERRRYISAVKHSLATGDILDVEHRLRRADGSYRWVRSRAYPRYDADGLIMRWYGTTEDIDDRVHAEQRRRQLEDKLKQADRLGALGQVAGPLAHELAQPLAAAVNYIDGSLALLARGDAASLARARFGIGEARRQIDHAAAVVGRLRRYIQNQTPDYRLCDLNQLLREAVDLAVGASREPRDVEISYQLTPALPLVRVDPIGMQLVIVNLVHNAFEAMEGADKRELQLGTASDGGMVSITISDSGAGLRLTEEELFEPFLSTKPAGLGLGLSICRVIVQQFGGQIRATDKGEVGTTFHIRLPASARGAEPDAAQR